MAASLIRTGLLAVGLTLVALLAATYARAAGWQDAMPMAEARSYAGAVAFGDSIYVAGGAGLTGPLDEFSAYDTIGDIWRPLPPMPVGRQNFGIAATEGGIFVSGGYAGDDLDNPADDFWRYDIKNAVWVKLAPMPSGRARHGLAAIGDTVYVIGGEGANASRVFAYSIVDGAWRDLGADLPVARTDLAVVEMGNRVFALGGRTATGATARVDVLDVSGPGRWSQGPSLPAARAEAAAGVVRGRIHLAGGRSNDPMRTHGQHYVLDGGRWTAAGDLPVPRLGAVAAGVNGRFYMIGGSGGAGVFALFTGTDTVEFYTP